MTAPVPGSALWRGLQLLGPETQNFIDMCAREAGPGDVPRQRIMARWGLEIQHYTALVVHFSAEIAAVTQPRRRIRPVTHAEIAPADIQRGRSVLPPGDRE